VEVPFNEIIDYVVAGKADAGLIIHEGQLMFQESGLELIVDLGVWWHDETGLPLPLGGNVVRKDLGEKTVKDATELFKTAVVYALDHRQEALDYAMTFARDMKRSLADKFVGMYVNDLTVDYGERGRKAVAKLFEMAYAKGLTTELIVPEFVD
jgi:1,4-dihydroxy-6-naphthoate synthase